MATKTLIGADVRRREDPALVQGAGRFVDDLAPPRLVFTSVLRSPHAHARLRRLDTMRAAAIPGVVRVITARDVDGTVDPEPAVGIPPAARRIVSRRRSRACACGERSTLAKTRRGGARS